MEAPPIDTRPAAGSALSSAARCHSIERDSCHRTLGTLMELRLQGGEEPQHALSSALIHRARPR